MVDTLANTAAMPPHFCCVWSVVDCNFTILLVLVAAFTRGGLSRHGVGRVPEGGTQDSTAMCELTRDLRRALSPPCVAKDSRSGEGLQVCLERGCSHLQLASSLRVPCARCFGQKRVLDQILQRAKISGAFFARAVYM